jgi:hypothetical protein
MSAPLVTREEVLRLVNLYAETEDALYTLLAFADLLEDAENDREGWAERMVAALDEFGRKK